MIILIVAMAGCAEPSFNYNYREAASVYELDNPCTPEFDDISLTGEAHYMGRLTVDENGVSHQKIHYNAHLTGEGIDGTPYVVNDVGNIELKTEDPSIQTVSSKVIGLGNTGNFIQNLVVQINPDGDIDIKINKSACRG